MSEGKFDFIISGAGLVGCLVTLQLAKSGYKCCLIEKNKALNKTSFKDYSPLSLNYRSYLLLKKFGLWDKLIQHIYPIKNLFLKSYHSLNRLRFEAKDIELDELGFVIDRRVFAQVLFDQVKQSKNISLHNESIINKLGNNKKNEFFGVYLDSTLSKKLLTKYLIISDGTESSLKNFLDIKSKEIDYSQTSFVFNANASFESSTAIQIFNKYGIFAMIPYAENKINLILTINNKYTSSFVGRNKQIDDMRIKEIFKNYINNLDSCNYVSEYNLITSRTHEIARKNILLLGNSSQLLHPVGAQGFNLAIRHIEMLMDHIKSENLDMLSLSKDIDKSRLDTFDHIDLATKILANDKIPSMLMTFGIINTVKSSRLLRNIFLKKILGLEGYAYLTIGSKA